MSDESLAGLRQQIDDVDSDINKLLARRAQLAGEVKKAKGAAKIYRPEREAAILERVVAEHQGPLPPESIRSVFREIIASCRNLEQKLRAAYLGPAGSYSHEAAQKLLGTTTDFAPENNLRAVLASAENGNADVALLPIENSSEGSVAETHTLLMKTQLPIIGEVRLPIRHCLLSHAETLTDIKAVYAHPQALGQCRDWLRTHLPQAEQVAYQSNSQAAAEANKNPLAAAIASEQAAKLIGMPMLAQAINDNPDNETRFVLLGSPEAGPTGSDKTSIICTSADKPGALYELLQIFDASGINLVRLESRPQPGRSYAFYIDLDGHVSDHAIAQTLEKLQAVAKTYKLLGSYPKAS